MNVVAAMVYWPIVGLWLSVLTVIASVSLRDPRIFGATRLLIVVVAIDTMRNIFENGYFGLYFGGVYGIFPRALVDLLGAPHLIVIPKLINVGAAAVVLGLLLRRWLPQALQERAAAEQDLHQAEWRFRLVVEGVRDYAIFLLDTAGRVASWNAGAERITGYPGHAAIGMHDARFYTDEDRDAGAPAGTLLRAESEGRFETEAWRVRRDGSQFWASVVVDAIRDPDGALVGFANVTRDITERRHAEEKLLRLAHYDQLTGLPNRTSLYNDLAALIAGSAASAAGSFSVAMLDLDGFKEINDTLGHSTGDRLLGEVARRLNQSSGQARVYRLGGDEFVLTFPGCGDLGAVVPVIDRILSSLAETFEINGHRLFIGASAGLAIAPEAGATADELLSSADLALYDAKAAGGGAYRLFLPALRAKAQERRQLGVELRRAFEHGEFLLYYQPQLRVRDGAVIGAEALLRWRHPERGVLAPGAFIDTLADSPIVLDVGKWILQAACQRAAIWHETGFPIRVSVNLFPGQFHDGALLDDVEAALRQSDLPAHALELEITENIALGRDEEVLDQLRTLRARGVGLAFDDFGTGYASLSYLALYPLTRIKVDQSFVRKISENSAPEDTAILRATITMGHNLRLKVIAEGVETLAQAHFLKAQGCEEVQGYLYAKPLAPEDFEQFLTASSPAKPVREAVPV